MTFKAINVHLDDGPACDVRLQVAVRAAVHFGGVLAGVYLVPTAEVTPSVAALLPPPVLEQRLRESGDAQKKAELHFRQRAARPGFRFDFRAPAGDPMDAAVAHARCADLTVVGQPDAEDRNVGFARRLAEHVLLESGAAMLVVPYIGAGSDLGRHVMIAWDGGRESARAVRDALPMLVEADAVTVVRVTRDPRGGDYDPPPHASLDTYLSTYGIRARFSDIEGAGDQVAERVLSEVVNAGADLLVMGGYGHARAREVVLGGTTRSIFNAMTVPVFMSH
jgi:nucleotide-binding universal stress UspA family protein